MTLIANPENKILRTNTIQTIFDTYPSKAKDLAVIMTRHGLHCVGCHASVFETLEQGILGHGFPESTLDALLAELNTSISSESPRAEIELTARAAAKIREMLREQNKEHWGLRFGLKQQTTPFEYKLNFRENKEIDELEVTSNGIRIFIPQADRSRLRYCRIDYVATETESGFKIENPNEATSTSCCH